MMYSQTWRESEILARGAPAAIGDTASTSAYMYLCTAMAEHVRLLQRTLRTADKYICTSCLRKSAFQKRTFAAQSTAPQHSSSKRSSAHNGLFLQSRTSDPEQLRSTRPRTHRVTGKRHASNGSLASTTAVNAPSTVPPSYRELYQRLLALEAAASSYVDIARLQLAARSLESGSPIIRVALLGLGANGALAATRLARVLLADALGQEETWEELILDRGRDGKPLLLKYGELETLSQTNPLVETRHIPSLFLQQHNLEILITTLNVGELSSGEEGANELREATLAPLLTTPNSAGGRVGFVRYPVHKAIIVAEGITGTLEYGQLPRNFTSDQMVTTALSLPLRPSTGVISTEEVATTDTVDIDLASHALTLFRTNTANGAQFSEEWLTSRLPAISEWLSTPTHASDRGMNVAIRNLVTSVLSSTSFAVGRAEAEQTSEANKATVTDAKRNDLQSTISMWSQEAHQDLQTNLIAALASKTWRRTAWWRLFWRIDDVSVSAGDILRLSWLTEAQQALAFVSGRIHEAGLATLDELKEAGSSAKQVFAASIDPVPVEQTEPKTAQAMTPADLLQTPTLLARMQQQSGVNALFDPPWPQTIHLSRQQMLHTLVPSMHAKAQALLLSAMTVTGGSAALGAWLYIATGGFMIYEAGAVAALGLVWSLRRMQRLWGKEREGFAITLQEDGRRVLAEVESHLRKIVKEGGRGGVRPEDARNWDIARRAVSRCAEALERIG